MRHTEWCVLRSRVSSRKRTESNGVVVAIPHGFREGSVSKEMPEGTKEAKLADIWEESIPGRASAT